MSRQYNTGGSTSDIGATQLNDFYFQKKALIEARKQAFFGQLSRTKSMPKHMGKTIKLYQYLPLLSDANLTDQGIDAAGASVTQKVAIFINKPENVGDRGDYLPYIATGDGANAGAALTAAQNGEAVDMFKKLGVFDTDYATTKAAIEALTPPWEVFEAAAVPQTGNLYGSSKDVGTVTAKMPALTENGGFVNRVGMKRIELSGTINKFGFYDEYTKESVDFDSDPELMMHVNREMVNGAHEMTEDLIQADLLAAAGVIRYGGEATSTSEITGDYGVVAGGVNPSLLTYQDLMRTAIDLDNNRCPKNTKIITGTRMTDTRVVEAARYLYIGTELITQIKRMTDDFGNQAFISVTKYAAGTTIANGEIGAIDQFRIIVVPEMMHWAGGGAAENVTTTVTDAVNAGYRTTGGKYDVFPALVVGSEAFTTIGFQTDGKSVKFKIKHSKPESEISYARDPYGETGFMSIKWYYGSIVERKERIALLKTVAEY